MLRNIWRYFDTGKHLKTSFSKQIYFTVYQFCFVNTALHSFLQCPGPALPCHQPRAWSIPIKDSGRRRHCPHPVPLNGLGLEVFFSLPQEGAVLLSPHCPQGFSPLVAISRLFTAQQFFGVQRKVQFTVSEAM